MAGLSPSLQAGDGGRWGQIYGFADTWRKGSSVRLRCSNRQYRPLRKERQNYANLRHHLKSTLSKRYLTTAWIFRAKHLSYTAMMKHCGKPLPAFLQRSILSQSSCTNVRI